MNKLKILKTCFWNIRYAPDSYKKTEDFKMIQRKLLKAAFGMKIEIDKSAFLKKLENAKKILQKEISDLKNE